MLSRPRFLVIAALLLAPVPAALAQQTPPKAEVMDEVIVTAPRNGEPDFQSAQEYHNQEYKRLNAMFGKPPRAEPRGDATMRSGVPAVGSDARGMIESAPRLRDTVAGN